MKSVLQSKREITLMENETIFLFMYVCHYRPRPGTLLFDFVAMCDCVQVNPSNLEFQLNFESIPPHPKKDKKKTRKKVV